MQQPTLFEKPLPFAGATYDYKKDRKRLTGQLLGVRDAMASGEWFTLAQLQAIVGGSEAGISARIRDLRKPAFGGYNVERRRVADSGLYQYRVKK
jgi:hypothetical protein